MRLTQLIKWILFGHLIKEADAIPKKSADIARETPEQPETKGAFLQYYDDHGVRFCKDLKEGDNCVGSSHEADFVVGAPDISAEHAVITQKGQQYFITNVSPEGKTFVNGEPLTKGAQRAIQFGAVILLAGLRMELLRRTKEA